MTRTRGSRAVPQWRPTRPALAALVLLVVAFQPAVAENEDTEGTRSVQMERANDLVRRVVERYEASDSYRISFTQETYWALADTVLTSTGELLVRRPLNVSINYEDGSRVATNGESLWVYTAQTNQFFATRVDSSDVVIDPPRLLKRYQPDPDHPFSTVSADSVMHLNQIVISMRPKGEVAELEGMDVYVDSEELLVLKLVARSSSSDWTRYIVQETLFDVETSADDFVFTRPPGSELITSSGGLP